MEFKLLFFKNLFCDSTVIIIAMLNGAVVLPSGRGPRVGVRVGRVRGQLLAMFGVTVLTRGAQQVAPVLWVLASTKCGCL